MLKIYEWLNREKARYYSIIVLNDGNNNFTLNYRWGSCNSNRGGKKHILVETEAEVQGCINQMMKRRKSRGYELQMP